MIIQKTSVSNFTYIYGCEVDDLPVSKEERINMHTAQYGAAMRLLDRLMQHSYDERDHDRIREVIAAMGWNEAMIAKLK